MEYGWREREKVRQRKGNGFAVPSVGDEQVNVSPTVAAQAGESMVLVGLRRPCDRPSDTPTKFGRMVKVGFGDR
jgi:hypothetical protein